MDEKMKKRLRMQMEKVMEEAMGEILLGDGQAGTVCLIGKGDVGARLPIEWESEKQKQAVFAAVRKTVRQVKPDWGIFGAESWIVERSPEEQWNVEAMVSGRSSVSQQPDRKECFCLIAEWKGGSIMMMQTFGRKEDGTPKDDMTERKVEESLAVMQAAIFGDAFQEVADAPRMA